MVADEEARLERLRAFAAAAEHREAMHRLVDELRSVETREEIDRIEAEMDRIGYEYEASLRTNGRTADQNHEFAPKRSELDG